LSIFINSSGN